MVHLKVKYILYFFRAIILKQNKKILEEFCRLIKFQNENYKT